MLPGNLVESQSFDRLTSGTLLRCISRSYSSVGRNSSPRFPKCKKRHPTGVEVANRYLRQRNDIYDTSMYICRYVCIYVHGEIQLKLLFWKHLLGIPQLRASRVITENDTSSTTTNRVFNSTFAIVLNQTKIESGFYRHS